MLVLVANVGSTSFKYKLFDMPSEEVLTEGNIERVGGGESPCAYVARNGSKVSETRAIPSFVEAISYVLSVLTDPEKGIIGSFDELGAVGFKTVHAKGYSGTQVLTAEVVDAMKEYSYVVPVHNPPYIRAIEDFARVAPTVPLVGLFETAFHQTMSDAAYTYAIPRELSQATGFRRYGFHGASHRYLTQRYAELKGISLDQVNIITCHMGGSSSLAAVKGGKSFDTSYGFSSQSGVPGSNRVGDCDCYVFPVLMLDAGLSFEEACRTLASESGLLGISGLSGEMRDLEEAAASGHERAQLAIDVFAHSVRKYLGSFVAILPEAEAVVFAGGIGERSPSIREKICRGLEHIGLSLDTDRNAACSADEMMISREDSRMSVWVIPTNEEIVVARETYRIIGKESSHG